MVDNVNVIRGERDALSQIKVNDVLSFRMKINIDPQWVVPIPASQIELQRIVHAFTVLLKGNKPYHRTAGCGLEACALRDNHERHEYSRPTHNSHR